MMIVHDKKTLVSKQCECWLLRSRITSFGSLLQPKLFVSIGS